MGLSLPRSISRIWRWLCAPAPRGKILFSEFGVGRRVGGEGYGFGGPETSGLVMAVAGVDAAPAVDDDVGAKFADDADHIFEDCIAPDFLGLLGSFGVAKIFGASEVEFYAVAASGSEQFLCADEAELGGLFGAESVLAAFTTS